VGQFEFLPGRNFRIASSGAAGYQWSRMGTESDSPVVLSINGTKFPNAALTPEKVASKIGAGHILRISASSYLYASQKDAMRALNRVASLLVSESPDGQIEDADECFIIPVSGPIIAACSDASATALDSGGLSVFRVPYAIVRKGRVSASAHPRNPPQA